MADRDEQRSARETGQKPRRQRSIALYIIAGVIGLAVVGCFVGIALLAGSQSGGTPIKDILAGEDFGDELVDVAGTIKATQPSSMEDMVWYRLEDSTGSIWVHAAVESESDRGQMGFIANGRLWVPAPGPEPEVGASRRVQGLVLPSTPPDGPPDAGPYILPVKPQTGG